MRILMTGAGGTLGAYLLPALLNDGHHITALVHHTTPKQDSISILLGDVTLPDFGLEDPPQVDAIVHCAGMVSFRHRPELLLTNIVAVEYATNLSIELGVPLFHISTAYVCGDAKGEFGPGDLNVLQNHRNAYEKSKFTAECIIRSKPGLEYTVIRPSILVGNSKIGGIPPMNGLYVAVRACYLGKRWLERKVGLLPIEPHIRLLGDPDATLNLIPVDLAARQIADLVKADARGTYFVTNEAPPSMKEIAAAASCTLEAQIEVVPDLVPNPAERLVLHLMRDIAPYMAGEPAFDNSTTWPLTQARCKTLPQSFLETSTRQFLGVHYGVSADR